MNGKKHVASAVSPYRSKDVCDEKHKALEERFAEMVKDMCQNTDDIKSINKKITATLVFVIVTLASVLTAIATGIFA